MDENQINEMFYKWMEVKFGEKMKGNWKNSQVLAEGLRLPIQFIFEHFDMKPKDGVGWEIKEAKKEK